MRKVVLLFVGLGILSISPFFIGRYLVGSVATLLTLGAAVFLFILLPRWSLPQITKQDVIWVIVIALSFALLFAANFSYDRMVDWSEMKSAAWALLAIALRPIGKSMIEALLDRIYGHTVRQEMLEGITGKTFEQAPELQQFARCGALAEGIYSAIVTGFALMSALSELIGDRTAQQLIIIGAMAISSPVVFWLHPDQRALRRYLSEER